MPLDPSIPLQVRPPQFQNPLEMYLQQAQLREAENRNALAQYQMARQREEDSRMSQVDQAWTQSGGDRTKYLSAIPGRMVPEAMKKFGEADEKTAKIEKEKIETALKTIEFHKNALTAVNDPASYEAWRQSIIRSAPQMAQMVPPQFSPEAKQQLLMTAQQMAERLNAKLHFADDGQSITGRNPYTNEQVGAAIPRMQSPESIAGNAVTMRGQNMVDARSREDMAFRQSQEKGEKAPSGFRWKGGVVGGELEAIPGGPASSKNLTETQGNATAFGIRARESGDLLNELEAKNTFGRVSGAKEAMRTGLERVPAVGTALGNVVGGAVNTVVSEAQQNYEQAKRNFISAVLRKESGAAISPTEFAEEDRKYFAQTGDGKAVIEQKRKARELAIQALKMQAGPGAEKIPASRTLDAGGGWTIKRIDK